MKNSKFQLPAVYAALNESEKSCVEGGGTVAQIFYAFGTMFRDVHYDSWKSESQSSEKGRGFVRSGAGEVQTGSDNETHEKANGSSWGVLNLGNFFNGFGRLFDIFHL